MAPSTSSTSISRRDDEARRAYVRFRDDLVRRLSLTTNKQAALDIVQRTFVIFIEKHDAGKLHFPTDPVGWERTVWAFLSRTAFRVRATEAKRKTPGLLNLGHAPWREEDDIEMSDEVPLDVIPHAMPDDTVDHSRVRALLDVYLAQLPERDRNLIIERTYSTETFEKLRRRLGFPTANAARQQYFALRSRFIDGCRQILASPTN